MTCAVYSALYVYARLDQKHTKRNNDQVAYINSTLVYNINKRIAIIACMSLQWNETKSRTVTSMRPRQRYTVESEQEEMRRIRLYKNKHNNQIKSHIKVELPGNRISICKRTTLRTYTYSLGIIIQQNNIKAMIERESDGT